MAQGFAYDDQLVLLGSNAKAYYGSVTGVPATEIAIVSFTASVPSVIKGVFGEGGTDAIFKLYINAIAVWEGRNAWTQRGIQTLLEKNLAIGDIVELKVTNQKSTNHIFTGGFYVYEL